jgi:hypothetical protein
MIMTFFDEGSPSNTLSVKFFSDQLRGKKQCKKTISEAILEQQGSTIWWKCGLLHDFENFNSLHLEVQRTRENRFHVQFNVVGVISTKAVNDTVGAAVCGAVIKNTNITKAGEFHRKQFSFL